MCLDTGLYLRRRQISVGIERGSLTNTFNTTQHATIHELLGHHMSCFR